MCSTFSSIVSAERASVSLPSFNSRLTGVGGGEWSGGLNVACSGWEVQMCTLLDKIKSLGAGEWGF